MPPNLFALPSDMGHRGREASDPPAPVMVVEDDDVHRGELRDTLAEEGYEVVAAANGKEALEYLIDRRRRRPAMILMDLSMPVMTGWELLAVIKSYVRLANIPVLLLSGVDPQLDPVKHGTVTAFLRKPYDLAKLLEIVARYTDAPGASASDR